MREVELFARLRRIVGAHAVDENERLPRFGAADADLRNRADRSGAAHLDARHVAQGVKYGLHLMRLQRFAGDDGDRAADLIGGHRHTAGAHHDHFRSVIRDDDGLVGGTALRGGGHRGQ